MLSVWLPRLASDRSLRVNPCEGAFAVAHRAGNADHLHCLNVAAEIRGLRRGMALADARALCPGLTTRPADLPREAAFLAALGRWLGRYSPWVARDGAEGLVADLSGAAHLFGGEAALRDDLLARLARAGLTAEAAIADTLGAAHALARHGGGIAAPGATQAALAALPSAALRIDSQTAAGLDRLGLRSIGALAEVPRGPLARRFGPGLLLRLDQALGMAPEPLSPDGAEPHFAVRLTLPEPIGLVSDVEAGLARLLERLCDTLARHGRGARRLRLGLRRVDRAEATVDIGLARPMREPARMLALFQCGIEAVDAGFGIDRLRLSATVTEVMPVEQLGPRHQIGEDRLADLVTRLGNRLGFDNVLRFLPAESHIPEKSFLTVPVAFSEPASGWPNGPERPLILFPPEAIRATGAEPPASFRWRRMGFRTGRVTGPERITPEWWLDDPDWHHGLRDYWKVETLQGRRLWLFHTPQNPGWYVQGEFA